LEDAIKLLSELGVQTVEIGTGGYVGMSHANPDELLGDKNKLEVLVQKI